MMIILFYSRPRIITETLRNVSSCTIPRPLPDNASVTIAINAVAFSNRYKIDIQEVRWNKKVGYKTFDLS